METIQVFYKTWEDPLKVAEQVRSTYPESDRYRFNLIVSPVCMKPGRAVREKRDDHQGGGCFPKLLEKTVDVSMRHPARVNQLGTSAFQMNHPRVLCPGCSGEQIKNSVD